MAMTDRNTPSTAICENPNENRTSLSLIERASDQDPVAWERLVKLYSPLVYFWCQESGLPKQDLNDVFQEVFHVLARNIKKFRPVENGTFRGWLRTLTRNKLMDHFRQAGREPKPMGGSEALKLLNQIPATTPLPSSSTLSCTMHGEDSPAEQAVLRLTLCQALSNVRNNFTDQTWRAFWMVVVDGRETSDVAKDLGMLPGTVRVAKSRVLKRLRLEIGDSLE